MRRSPISMALAGLALAAAAATVSTKQVGVVMSQSRRPRNGEPGPYTGGRKVKAQWKRERGMR